MADTQIAILNRYRDASLEAFEQHLQDIIRRTQQATLDYVMSRVEVEDGVVTRTPRNLKLMRRLNLIFMRELDKAGYNTLLNAFVSQFPGQLPMMQEQIRTLVEAAKANLPNLDFTAQDLNVFKSVAATNAEQLRHVIQTEAARALAKVMFSVGGMRFKDMVELIMKQGLAGTVGRAKIVADTAMAMFHRAAQAQQYEKIQKANPGRVMLYKYVGVKDSRNRPFCAGIFAQNRKWTREEIDKLDNGQLPNCFVTAGGFGCRQDWSFFGFADSATA